MLFDDENLAKKSSYKKTWAVIKTFSKSQPVYGPYDHDLITLLKEPVMFAPESLKGQLEYIQKHWGTWLGEWVKRIFVGMDTISEEEKAYHSVENHVNSDTPPAFIWHTSEDGAVPVHSSLKLGMAYANAGVPFALHVYPYGPHGIALATEYSNAHDGVNRVQPLAYGWLEDSIEWMKTIK